MGASGSARGKEREMTARLARRSTLALFVVAALALAAPAAAAPRAARGNGWLAVLWGGLERMWGAQGGCIDPNGARCNAQPSGNGQALAAGLTSVVAAEGGCIDPNGARCAAQPAAVVPGSHARGIAKGRSVGWNLGPSIR